MRVFQADARVSTFDTGCDSVLGIFRERNGERFWGLFHFGQTPVRISLGDRLFKDMVRNQTVSSTQLDLPAYGFLWLKEANEHSCFAPEIA